MKFVHIHPPKCEYLKCAEQLLHKIRNAKKAFLRTTSSWMILSIVFSSNFLANALLSSDQWAMYSVLSEMMMMTNESGAVDIVVRGPLNLFLIRNGIGEGLNAHTLFRPIRPCGDAEERPRNVYKRRVASQRPTIVRALRDPVVPRKVTTSKTCQRRLNPREKQTTVCRFFCVTGREAYSWTSTSQGQ